LASPNRNIEKDSKKKVRSFIFPTVENYHTTTNTMIMKHFMYMLIATTALSGVHATASQDDKNSNSISEIPTTTSNTRRLRVRGNAIVLPSKTGGRRAPAPVDMELREAAPEVDRTKIKAVGNVNRVVSLGGYTRQQAKPEQASTPDYDEQAVTADLEAIGLEEQAVIAFLDSMDIFETLQGDA
jgi:hypothetical protein